MLADVTQHQLFVRLSSTVPADITLLSNKIYFVLWFFNRLQLPADNYKIPAQQQAVNVGTLSNTKCVATAPAQRPGRELAKPWLLPSFFKLPSFRNS